MLKALQVGTTAPLPERWVSAPKLLFLSVLGVLGWLVIFNKFGFGWVSSLDFRCVPLPTRSVATLVLVSAHSMERTTGGAQSRPGEEEFQHSDYFLMVRLDYNIDFQQMGKSQEEQKR